MSTNWNELIERHEIAYLRGDLATSSPESYTIEEMKEISDGMFESTAEIGAALKTDFESLPPEAREMLLDMLYASDCMTPEFWREVLLGKMPNSPAEVWPPKPTWPPVTISILIVPCLHIVFCNV